MPDEPNQILVTPVAFDATGLERVVADPLRFKQRLRIGEDAYALLRAKNQLFSLWDTAGAAATGAAVASSSMVAGTFFAPTGVMAALGLATAATPVGWVVGAAVLAGGGWYGASRWFSGKGPGRTCPRFGDFAVHRFGSSADDGAALDRPVDRGWAGRTDRGRCRPAPRLHNAYGKGSRCNGALFRRIGTQCGAARVRLAPR